MQNKFKPIIGLEIHVELKTKSKMFCGCPADHFGKKPNTQTCPVCLGLPGALPVPNKKAVEWTILIGKALNCKINKISKFDRKHYFYPDLPKGYQISQYDEPIAINGLVNLGSSPEISPRVNSSLEESRSSDIHSRRNFGSLPLQKKFRIRRVHLEEDTGKLIHLGGDTLVDFNRSGVPLIEVVTEPDFDNADDVKRFLEELQVIVRYLGVSDADMEKGSMRLEPNISVSVIPAKATSDVAKAGIQKRKWIPDQVGNDKGLKLPSYKVEIKNINSFRFVKQAIEYEVKRQIEILERREIPKQETRGFAEKKGITYSQRSKEEAHDYRYFPEPDIPPMSFDDDYVKQIERQLPELPHMRVVRYVRDMGLRYQDAFLLTRDKKIAEYFEEVISNFQFPTNEPDQRSVHGPIPSRLIGTGIRVSKQASKSQIPNFKQLIANLIINKKVPTNIPAHVFIKKVNEFLTPKETDEKTLDVLINRLIDMNKKAVEDYRKGKENAIMFLVGQVMREMKGQADAKIVISKIKNQIAKI